MAKKIACEGEAGTNHECAHTCTGNILWNSCDDT